MRRKSTELNIFSMSALDLFASAMGAFILLFLIVLPYYMKENPIDPAPVPEKICPEPVPIPDCPICPTPRPIPECPEMPEPTIKFSDNLLVIEMIWEKKVDIDLYVHTPYGKFYHGKTHFDRKPGKLTLDSLHGGTEKKPALEVWRSFEPLAGKYRVCYVFYSERGLEGSVSVRVEGRLDKPTGPVIIPAKVMRKGEEVCPLIFSISRDHTFTLDSLE